MVAALEGEEGRESQGGWRGWGLVEHNAYKKGRVRKLQKILLFRAFHIHKLAHGSLHMI